MENGVKFLKSSEWHATIDYDIKQAPVHICL